MHRKSLIPGLLPGVIFLALAGCGTILSPASQTVNIQSEPQGVDLYLDGQRMGETPVSVEVDRDTFKSKIVMLKKEGYETKQFNLKKTINSVSIFNFTLMTPWATDAVTGNMIEYSPNNYYIELKAKRPLARREENARLLKRFVLLNYDNVLMGISDGGGEYVSALMEILDVPHESRERFVRVLQERLPDLLESASPVDVILSIQHRATEQS